MGAEFPQGEKLREDNEHMSLLPELFERVAVSSRKSPKWECALEILAHLCALLYQELMHGSVVLCPFPCPRWATVG